MARSNEEAGLNGLHLSIDSPDSDGLPWQHDLEQYAARRDHARQSMFSRLLSLFDSRRNDRRDDDLELSDLPLMGSAKRGRYPREVRRCRRSVCLSAVAKGFCATPILILIFFGVIHVLEALVGRARFFWNDTSTDLAFFGKNTLLHHTVGREGAHGDLRPALVPIPCHSHNDYWRDQPLFDAIRWGCIGVEADVWLFDGELYVGHNAASLTEDRTLRSLYINPLEKLLDQSMAASSTSLDQLSVFETTPSQTLTLLIDFKNEPQDTFRMVHEQLNPLREKGYLSFFDGESVVSRAITVVGTGITPFNMVVDNSTHRDIFFDAPLHALWEPPRDPISKSDSLHDKDGKIDYGTAMALSTDQRNSTLPESSLFNSTNSYYASTSFASAVGFVWRGHLSPRQMNIIRGQIRGAKLRGLKARYWNTPAWPTSLRNHVWHVLVKEGADLLSVDDLEAAALQDWTVRIHDNLFW